MAHNFLNMKIYFKYIFTSIFFLLLGFNLIGQSNKKFSSLILSKEKLENIPTATFKENESNVNYNKSVNSQIVEIKLVPQNNQTQLRMKNSDNEISNGGKKSYNVIDVKPSKTIINNVPKVSFKKK